jgi:hypothetical protein
MNECTPCSPGMYCAGSANTAPTAQCASGYFCS